MVTDELVEKFTEGYISEALRRVPGIHRDYTALEIPKEVMSLIRAECKIILNRSYEMFDKFFANLHANIGLAGRATYALRNGWSMSALSYDPHEIKNPWRYSEVLAACKRMGRFKIVKKSDDTLTCETTSSSGKATQWNF